MATAIDLTFVRQQLSDCLGLYPRITAAIQRRWEDEAITTEEMIAVLACLRAMPPQAAGKRPQDPGSIEYALRDRHHQCTNNDAM